MKKIIRLTAILLLILINERVNAQVFEKGNINIDLGLGLGIYGTTATFTTEFLGVPITFTDKDGAASTIIPIGVEYGLTDKIGLGIQLGFTNYFIDNEDSTETTESVRSVDFALKVNYHLITTDKNDLFIAIGLGGTSVNWKNLNGDEFSGSGSYFSLYLTDRIFFNDYIGILFNLGYTGYNYSEIDAGGIPFSLEWSLNGINLGTGIAVKF